MTFYLTLPAELEARLRQQAARLQLPPDALTIKLLDEHLPPAERNATAVALLRQWMVEAETLSEEECQANAAVLRALDADRLSNRKLFADLESGKPA